MGLNFAPRRRNMWQAIKLFKDSGWQTKLFILICAIYMLAMVWTTIQAYARLQYSRSDRLKPLIIEAPAKTE